VRDQNRLHKPAPRSRNVRWGTLLPCVESIEIDELRVVRMRIVQAGYATIGSFDNSDMRLEALGSMRAARCRDIN
jgi:hypothetical protein